MFSSCIRFSGLSIVLRTEKDTFHIHEKIDNCYTLEPIKFPLLTYLQLILTQQSRRKISLEPIPQENKLQARLQVLV